MDKEELRKELDELCYLYSDLEKYLYTESATERADKWLKAKEKLINRILTDDKRNKSTDI